MADYTMKKILILLTNAFPYGHGEPYLETEVNYYDVFDKIYICSLQIGKEQAKTKRSLPSDKFTIIPVWFAAKIIYILYTFIALADKNLYKEIGCLIHQRKISLRRIISLFIYVSRAHYESRKILQFLKKIDLYDSKEKGVIYSYRFEYQPYVGLLIQKHLPEFKIIARGHRYDLYEELNSISYIPMRELLLQRLDKVIMISEDGKDYLTRKYPKYADKIIVFRLGTTDHGIKEVKCPNGEINLVSCSYVTPIKRVNLIVESLSLIKDITVKWTHYGKGECLEKIKSQCESILSPNIRFELRGEVPNKEVMKEYSEKPYHLFLNVSSSEGVPVSIMEALSFGMPCIATDVGGTNEIIKNEENGILLFPNFTIEELSSYIRRFAKMDEHEYQTFRDNARLIWETEYNANQNYVDFVSCLYQLCR